MSGYKAIFLIRSKNKEPKEIKQYERDNCKRNNGKRVSKGI